MIRAVKLIVSDLERSALRRSKFWSTLSVDSDVCPGGGAVRRAWSLLAALLGLPR